MKNTYLIAAVVALGLFVPAAFFAGQHVSKRYERSESATLGDGSDFGTDDGPVTTTLPLEEVSFNFFVDGDTSVEYRQYGPSGEMKDCLDWKGDEVYAGHRNEIEIETWIVPPDWDGMAKVCGQPTWVRVHEPLVPPGQGGEIDDKSSPLLFLGLSYGGREDEPDTRAFDMFLKVDTAESDEVFVFSALDEMNPTLGARIWMNISMTFDEGGKWSNDMKTEIRYSVMIELPKEMLTSYADDKSTPFLYLSVGAHPEVVSAGALKEYGLGFAVESEVPVRVWWYDYDCEIIS